MHVVVSGAAGQLGRVLLPRLCADGDVHRVTGIDLRPNPVVHDKFRALRADVASAPAQAAVHGADALVHLAFVLLRGRRTVAAMAESNVGGSRALLGAAARAGVARLVFLSSAAVYGAGENLGEDAALAPLARFEYARQKLECERWLASEMPQAVVFRPHIILGPNALPLLKRLANSWVVPRLAPPLPRLQCVHEEDVATAIITALKRQVAGPFNLAAEEAFDLRQLARARHAWPVALPLPLLRAALATVWRLTGWGGEPAWLDGVTRTLTLDCTRARRQLGWQPRYPGWRAILQSTFEG